MTAPVSPKPYLLRAMHEWISDCGHTPHVIVDAAYPGAQVPKAYVKEGRIVLNLSMTAAPTLKLGNEEIELDTRFGGVSHHLRFPVDAVLGIYARETGEGMPLDTREPAAAVSPPATAGEETAPAPAQAPMGGAAGGKPATPGGGRPQLRVVK